MQNGWGSTMYGAREGVGGGNEKNDRKKKMVLCNIMK